MRYASELIGKRTIAEGTAEFTFAKPEGFSFHAGQSVDLVLEGREGPMSRSFSIVSAPRDGHLSVAMRLRDSAFKRVLSGMPPGAPVLLEGPFGSFQLHEDPTRPAVFMTGGIGITPFMSIVRDAADRGLPHRMTLVYSSRMPEDIIYGDELAELEERHGLFTVVHTVTRSAEPRAGWSGETGRISMELISRNVRHRDRAVYYVTGSLAMVAEFERALIAAGTSRDDIRTEEFPGY